MIPRHSRSISGSGAVGSRLPVASTKEGEIAIYLGCSRHRSALARGGSVPVRRSGYLRSDSVRSANLRRLPQLETMASDTALSATGDTSHSRQRIARLMETGPAEQMESAVSGIRGLAWERREERYLGVLHNSFRSPAFVTGAVRVAYTDAQKRAATCGGPMKLSPSGTKRHSCICGPICGHLKSWLSSRASTWGQRWSSSGGDEDKSMFADALCVAVDHSSDLRWHAAALSARLPGHHDHRGPEHRLIAFTDKSRETGVSDASTSPPPDGLNNSVSG